MPSVEEYERVTAYLVEQGYDAELTAHDNLMYLTIRVRAGDTTFELIHGREEQFTELPRFLLKDSTSFGRLAHVLPFNRSSYGDVCVGDRDSVSINFEQPHLAVELSLQRHIALIQKALEDPEWNMQELLREFHANWNFLLKNSDPDLILAAKEKHLELIQVYNPAACNRYGYGSYHLGITQHASELPDFLGIAPTKTVDRTQAGEGFVVTLSQLKPPPSSRDALGGWYFDTISSLPQSDYLALTKLVVKRRSNRFWVIFNGDTPSGTTWFGLQLKPKGKGKRTLPLKSSALNDWSITPVCVTVFNKERVLPRGGADTALIKKSVLLVGCGSIGGEIAYKLASSGLGRLCLVDPDRYSLDNLYRHILDDWYVGCEKAIALSIAIRSKHPWTACESHVRRLLSLRDKKFLESFDLVIIGIGSPTHERIFHDFLIERRVTVPVINTWVEGYGIGGHATLDIPGSSGCLRCAYVDQSDLSRGLASNMNFLEPNQDVTINHAGCGDLFLPYGAINAAQTALIASDLAVQFLTAAITSSCKVSWKGSDSAAKGAGLKTTHRYHAFKNSLERLPLYDPHCDLCNE